MTRHSSLVATSLAVFSLFAPTPGFSTAVISYGPPIPPGYLIPDDDVEGAKPGEIAEPKAEVLMSKASLEYHAKRYPQCLETLELILKRDPDHVGALELRALTYRQLSDDKGAVATYEKLLESGTSEKRAAYHYELGSIHYRLQEKDRARRHFDLAASGNFNPGTSHFLLGLLEFKEKNWPAARHHLTASLTYSDAKTMEPVTRYYLANTYTQIGKTESAIRTYHAMTSEQTAGGTRPNSTLLPVLDDVHANALKELRTFDNNQTYLNVGLLSQWDSNVQTNPSEAAKDPDVASSQRSLKSVLNATFAYSTSPLKNWQFTPSYRLFTNYNLNEKARDFNFVTHTLGGYALHRPYERLSYGMKAEATYSMKNTPDQGATSSSLEYKSYSLTGDVAAVGKYELNPRIGISGELGWRPKKFYGDPDTGDYRRGGQGFYARVTGDFISGFWWWNPLAYLGYELDSPEGKNYKMGALGAGLQNPIDLSEKLTLTPALDLNYANYSETTPRRTDTMISGRLLGSYAVAPRWTAMGDVGYTRNGSTVPASYQYNRWVASGGVSYTF